MKAGCQTTLGLISFLLISVFAVSPSFSQSFGQWNLKIGNTTYLSSGNKLPFWFHSNKFGVVDENSANNIFNFEIERVFSEQSTFDYKIKASLLTRFSENSKVFFNELYAELKAGAFHLYVGKKKWRDGIWQSDLSLGSMVWSGNAATMPKVMLSLPEYISVPYTADFVAFKGYIGFGWFGDDRYVKDPYLHEKAIYLRFLPEEYWVNGHIGVIHNVQWGGVHPVHGQMPQGFDTYWKVFWGKAGEPGKAHGGEVINAIGNTVGAFEAKLAFDFDKISINAYRQFFIENSVSTRFRSPWDGLWGVEIVFNKNRNGWITHLLYEHVNTTKQNAQPGEVRGADQYYANFLYESGWTYKGRNIGLPLAYTGVIRGTYPHMATGVTQVINNIIIAHHIGLKGNLLPGAAANGSPFSYKLMATYSRNYGRLTSCGVDEFCGQQEMYPLRTPRKDQVYMQLNLKYSVNRKWNIWGGIGIDFGEIYDTAGLYFGVSYTVF